ncbi:hypothetical protein F4V57_09350 [Acinetobacter qingfengensis]|uniref:Uncharacterized protein n=1 Tax=Acinetobacter qingfengensis TaxID=1262585 RepID=A0A1E7RFS5_9GAMM|nr:hypothetical protein [Acinetobacter qingfengensis]KAA8732828.1 hypothetical protein F4V57_09350 [Acinetobacter qingfengensis]OEY98224.1 hypothetical protein BJI46_00990 [Acinetobacter qingfengensis]
MNAWKDSNQNWKNPIFVMLYPINADGSITTAQYIEQLDVQDFQPISEFLQQQAQQYHQSITIYFKLGSEIKQLTPQAPNSSSVLGIMLWSLKFRYYAWRYQQNFNAPASLSLYLNFYDMKTHSVLQHSTALEKGRVGLVNLFASAQQHDQNQIVIAHEMLHAFGATDKYDFISNQPIYPEGYADPDQQPLYPQHRAELMSGKIAWNAEQSKMADHLNQIVVRNQTAQEIGWIKP